MWNRDLHFVTILVFVVLACSCRVEAKKSYKPEQIHLSYGDDDLQVVVTWSTHSATPTPTVIYGTGSKKDFVAEGVSRLFVDGGKKQRKQFVHRVTLSGLQPNTTYKYICGSAVEWSGEYEFNTAPASNWSPNIAVIGDLGSVNGVSIGTLSQRTQLGAYDAILHVGDIAYDMADHNGKLGDEFMNQIQPIASRVPYMVCPGNHEHQYNFSHFRERFSMPGNTENMFYSFNMGPAHFVSVNTEGYWYPEYFGKEFLQQQYHWLINDLQEANKNRTVRPWIILYGHRPMYCSGISDECFNDAPTRSGITIDGVKQFGLEKLLNKYGVDLVFWGHQHNYERFWPVYNNQVKNGTKSAYVDPKATVHIVSGSGGSDELIEPFAPNRLEATAYRNADYYSYTEMKIHNKTHLALRQIATSGPNNPIVDDLMIIKNYHGPY